MRSGAAATMIAADSPASRIRVFRLCANSSVEIMLLLKSADTDVRFHAQGWRANRSSMQPRARRGLHFCIQQQYADAHEFEHLGERRFVVLVAIIQLRRRDRIEVVQDFPAFLRQTAPPAESSQPQTAQEAAAPFHQRIAAFGQRPRCIRQQRFETEFRIGQLQAALRIEFRQQRVSRIVGMRIIAFQLQRGQERACAGIAAAAQIAGERAVQFGCAGSQPQRSQRGSEVGMGDRLRHDGSLPLAAGPFASPLWLHWRLGPRRHAVGNKVARVHGGILSMSFFARPSPKRLLRLPLALALLLCALAAHAWQRDFFFRHLDSRDGLAQNSVSAILQDSHGYIWLATQGGLHRYDGYTLRRFQHDPARADSLPDNLVTALADAGNGRLWVGSNSGGVVLFDPDHDRVLPGPARVDSRVYALQPLPDGVMVATARDVERLDARGGRPRKLWQSTNEDAAVRMFARCPDGALFAAAPHVLLAIGNDDARVLMHADTRIDALYCDRGNRLLLGDAQGLTQIDRASGAKTSIALPSGVSHVTRIAEDRAGRLWLAVDNNDLLRLDAQGRAVRITAPPVPLAGSAPSAEIARLFVDASGLLWIGTNGDGAYWTDPDGAPFRTIVNLAASHTSGANHLRAFYEAGDGSLWLGVVGEGLVHYNPTDDSFESFADALQHAAQTSAAASQVSTPLRVYAILPDVNGTLLLATSRGIMNLDPRTRRASPADLPGDDPQTRATPDVRALLRTRNGDLWLAQFDDGVLHYHEGALVHHYRARAGADDALASDTILNLVEDRSGRIWAGTADGLSLIDPATDRVRSFREQPGRGDSLSGHTVADVMIGRDDTVWVGTLSGLDRLLWIDDGGAHFRRYGLAQGLPDTTVYCMLEDARGAIWFSTNLGLGRLNPRDGSVRAWQARDGLQGDEYDAGACTMLRDGRLAFGGMHGFDVIDTGALRVATFQPPVLITGLRVGAHEVPLPAPGEALRIPADARSLHVDFAALDYGAPARNRFRYRLVGYDDEWIDAGTRHSATWTNLVSGDYRFEVQGSDRDGVFGATATLPVRVQAYWWWSTGMRVLYAVVLALCALALLLAWRGKRLEELHHQRQLRLREDRLRLALWGSGDEFWDWDLHGGMMFRMGAESLQGG